MADKAQNTKKQRLDVALVARGLAESREIARRLIMAGEVSVDGQVMDKPGHTVSEHAGLELRTPPRFVSRGGDKLDAALTAFGIDVSGRVCADVGASTGGFTDCLLKRGAAKVYAIDVGYGQLDYRLRNDPRVVVMERTNARYVDSLAEPVTLVSVDASFISLRLLLPAIKQWLAPDQPSVTVVPLIKPQFEAGREDVGKGGVVKSPEVHRRVLQEVLQAAQNEGFAVGGVVRSPLKGPAGNIEFLAWLHRGAQDGFDLAATIDDLIETPAPDSDTA
jgi:23S rRNA (cytidine1920-2'-O)/16S rRNA (cytidine1409-2'-O)-methyltransferase